MGRLLMVLFIRGCLFFFFFFSFLFGFFWVVEEGEMVQCWMR